MLGHNEAAGGIGECVRAYTAVHYQARICAGDTVLIIDGATPFGSAAIQITKHWGAKVHNSVILRLLDNALFVFTALSFKQ